MRAPIVAIVLAAGQGWRMGPGRQQLKLLLPWGDTTILGQTLRHVQRSSLDHILVVTGHEAAAVAAIAAAHQLPTIHNPHYATGEMLSSLQAGLRQVADNCAAVLVVLADQPLVTPAIIDQLLAAYRQGPAGIVAPIYQGQRGNPVLFDRRHFAGLLALPAGAAPRDLLQKHPADMQLVAVDSDAILADIDRPEDYERLRPGHTPAYE